MSGKEMTDNEWTVYMMKHYIKENEDRNKIFKDLNITESYFYKRNRKLGIKRERIINKKKKYKFNYLSGKFCKGKINLG